MCNIYRIRHSFVRPNLSAVICVCEVKLETMAYSKERYGFDISDSETANNGYESSESEFSGLNSSSSSDEETIIASDSDGGERPRPSVPSNQWSSKIDLRQIPDFQMLSGPTLPRNFNVDTAAPIDYFDLMMDNDMYDKIAVETNDYAALCQREKNKPDESWMKTGGPTTGQEIKAYFGLSIIMGVHPLPEYSDYWSSDPYLGVEGFKRVLTKNR